MKTPVWKYIFATFSFWAIAFLGDIVLLLLNGLAPSFGRYDVGTLGYYFLCLVSSAISAAVAVTATNNILEERHPRFVCVNCVVASIGFSIVSLSYANSNFVFAIKVILAVAVFVFNAIKYKRLYNKAAPKPIPATQPTETTPEPAALPEPMPSPNPEPDVAPTLSSGIDLSGLTDEQKALVAQLVDSMKK